MTPSLSSSTTDTPSTKALTSTPLRSYTCTKCKLSKAGHPRSGCPFVDLPPAARVTFREDEDNACLVPSKAASQHGVAATPDLAFALRSPGIPSTTPTSPHRSKRGETSRCDPVLQSPHTDSSILVQTVADVTRDAGDREALAEKTKPGQLQKLAAAALAKALKVNKSSKTTAGSTAGISNPFPDITATKTSRKPPSSDTPRSCISVPHPLTEGATRPLARTMNMEERQLFLDHVHGTSTVAIYRLPNDNIPEIQLSATALGLFSQSIDMPSRLGQISANGEGWLILGRTKQAVECLFETFQQSHRAPRRSNAMPLAIAGGVIGGAVATWAGLAYT